MPGTDIHTHLAPRLGATTVAALSGVELEPDHVLAFEGHRAGPPALYDPAALEAYLDRAGLDQAVVSVPPPFYRQHLDSAIAAEWARAINDGLADAVHDHPRLRPLAYLPLKHPEVALAEFERTRTDDRFVGTTASAGGASVVASDPRLEPLWKGLDADGTLLLLHPGSSPDARLGSFYLSNLLGNPAETSVAAAHLVFGGVLTRFPQMHVVLVHCGGTLPAVVGRWQRGVDTARPGTDHLVEPPVEAVRRLYVDCLAHDPAVVDLAVSTFGPDRILLGSDWPFPMGTDNPMGLIEHRGDEFVRRVAVDNPRQLLRNN